MKSVSNWIGVSLALIPSAVFAQSIDIAHLRKFVGREDKPVLTNAREIEQKGFMKHELPTLPWSSSFWPDMAGSVANPYADRWSIPLAWKLNQGALWGRGELYARLDQLPDEKIADFSPAEKYDLLMGDPEFTFTRSVLKRVDQLYDLGLLDLGSLWSGICHGWSPASLTMPRPKHAITLVSPTGRKIPFYPSDVKALQTIAWGDAFGPGGAQYSVKVEGKQCRSGAEKDVNGRLKDPSCFDVNPAFFHLLAVNQIGLNEKGFVMDREYKSAVQNQPTFGYRFKFYKITDRYIHTDYDFDDARVEYTSAVRGRDRYYPYRSPKTRYLVGVEARVDYAMESDANHDLTDDGRKDNHDHAVFRYDLELDDNNEIVGGEWREYDETLGTATRSLVKNYKHPDIVWLVPEFVEPWSLGDWDIKDVAWEGTGPVPPQWREASLKSSAWVEKETWGGKLIDKRYPQPLLRVVKVLQDLSTR